MKKLLSLLVVLLISCQINNAWAIDEFLKAQPADTINPGTIGTVIRVNNEAIDRFFAYGRFDCKINYVAAAQVNVGSGSIVCSNVAGTVRKLRTNTSTVNCTWSDLDSGVEAASTTYYLWAVGDTDATTFTVKISTSATAPTGVTYYKRLGSFYNDASSNITQIINDNNPGKSLGSWVSKSADTVYQASSDGFVVAYGQGYAEGDQGLFLYTDSSNPPTTLRAKDGGSGSGTTSVKECVMSPVKMGDYYKITNSTGATATVYWIPLE